MISNTDALVPIFNGQYLDRDAMLALVALHAQPQWQVMDPDIVDSDQVHDAFFTSERTKFLLPFRYPHKYKHNIMRDI